MSRSKLSQKDIDKIAGKVEVRLRSNPQTTKPANGGGNGRFVWGALAGIAAAAAVPVLAPRLRPAVRGVIKSGIVTGRYLRRTAEGVQEDLQDMTAEARADLDREQPAKES